MAMRRHTMRVERFLVKHKDRVGLLGRLLLGVVDLPCAGGRGHGLRDGIVGVDVGREALQRGKHVGRLDGDVGSARWWLISTVISLRRKRSGGGGVARHQGRHKESDPI